MRKLILLFISALLVAGSLAATLGTASLRDFELRGYVDPTQDQTLPFTEPRMGVNVDLLQYDEAQLRRNLDMISQAGFVWLRQFAYWDEIEPEPGDFDFSGWDALEAAMSDYPHLRLVAVLMNSPAWAREKPGQPQPSETAPPQDPAAFAAFAGAFAARYGAWIEHYQIWDEPNLADAWGGSDPRAADYVALLAAARAAITLVHPSATIVAAGLAPTTETGGRNISDMRYLDAMYRLGAGQLMDVVAGKPYGFSLSPLDRRVDESLLNYSRIIALREVMAKHGDGKKRLWASNYGWNALPDDWSGEPSIWGAVNDDQRTRFTLQALDRAHREWSWLGAMFLHQWQPAAPQDDPQWGFALVDHDGQPSPLLHAISAYPQPELAQNGLFHAVNDHARYSGDWQFSDLGADIGPRQPSDSQFEFDFYGADLALLLREDDYVAFLYPTVDGQPANAAQRDADGNAYIFLRSNSRGPETNLAPVAKDLPLGPHQLHASADSGWDRWAIAGFAVSSGNLSLPYDRQIALGIIATILSLLAFLHSILTAPWGRWLPALIALASGISATLHLLITGVASFFMMLAMLLTWNSPRAPLLLRDEVNLALALISGGLLYVSPSLLLSLLLALGLFVLIYQRLATGLVLTLFWAPFFLFPVELYSFAFPMVEVMILITSAAGFCHFMAALGRRLRREGATLASLSAELLSALRLMDLAVAGIGLLGCLSLLWAEQQAMAQTELRTLIIEPLLFYVLLRATGLNKRTMIQLFAALIVAGVLAALIGLVMYFSKSGDFYSAQWGFRRLDSVYGSANNAGLLFGRALPIALAFLLVDRDRRSKILAGLALLIMLPALALTMSSGAILLGAPAGLVMVFIAAYGRRAVAPLLAIGALGAGTFALLARLSDRLAYVMNFGSGTTFVRLRLWESSLAILMEHPLTGIGMDQFLYQFGGEYIKPDAIWDRDLSHPHNFALDFWIRLGILGLLCFLVIQYCFWRGMLQLWKQREADRPVFAMALGLAGSMAALLSHGLIDNSVFVIDLAFIFMFQLAACLRLGELSARD